MVVRVLSNKITKSKTVHPFGSHDANHTLRDTFNLKLKTPLRRGLKTKGLKMKIK